VEQLGQRLRHVGLRARTVDLKVRTADFQTYTRAVTLPEPTDTTAVLWETAAGLFDRKVPDDWLPLRLLGVGAVNLTSEVPVQGHLFEGGWRKKQRALDQALDAIRRQFGREAVRRAGGLDHGAG
jgi:DNA polymerase-4